VVVLSDSTLRTGTRDVEGAVTANTDAAEHSKEDEFEYSDFDDESDLAEALDYMDVSNGTIQPNTTAPVPFLGLVCSLPSVQSSMLEGWWVAGICRLEYSSTDAIR
jgi:hypothetical protein